MSHFCGIHYTTSKQQRDFIVLDTTQGHRCYTQRTAISKYGLHTETTTFPEFFNRQNQERVEGKRTGNSNSLKKKREVEKKKNKRGLQPQMSQHIWKTQWLTVSFPSQVTSGTGSFSSFLEESIVNWVKEHSASQNCKNYKVLPDINTPSVQSTHLAKSMTHG